VVVAFDVQEIAVLFLLDFEKPENCRSLALMSQAHSRNIGQGRFVAMP
jgi:hypothetical protein